MNERDYPPADPPAVEAHDEILLVQSRCARKISNATLSKLLQPTGNINVFSDLNFTQRVCDVQHSTIETAKAATVQTLYLLVFCHSCLSNKLRIIFVSEIRNRLIFSPENMGFLFIDQTLQGEIH